MQLERQNEDFEQQLIKESPNHLPALVRKASSAGVPSGSLAAMLMR